MPLCHPIRDRPKPIIPRSYLFSHASHQLHIFAWSFYWFSGLPVVSFVIGQSNNLGFDFMTLDWKPFYSVYPSHCSQTLFNGTPPDPKKVSIFKWHLYAAGFILRENVWARNQNHICNDEVSNIKQVSVKWDLTNSSLNLVTCTLKSHFAWYFEIGLLSIEVKGIFC